MPLPADYGTGHVTGKFVVLDGTPVVGWLTFKLQPDVEALIDDAHETVIMPAPLQVALDGTGSFAIDLPATDDPDITPAGWSYVVEETFTNAHGREYSLDVPVGGSVDISQVVIAAPAPAVTTINWGPSTDHVERVESVLAHGADPGGGADSASAFTAALAEADNGGTAYLPEGLYRIDSDVDYPTPNTTTFQPSPRLRGDGPNRTIVLMSPGAKINVAAPTIDGTGAFTAGPQAFIEIDGITFLGDGGGTCLYLHRYFKLLISNCRFDKQPGAAYSFDKCIESVRALQTTPTRHDDLQIQAQINNCLFMFFNVGYDDLALSSPANTAFNNCYFQGLTPADTAAQQVIDPDFASVGIRTCSNSLGGVGTSFVSLDVGLWLDQGGESNQVDVLPKGIHLDRWHFEGNRYADVHIERCVGLKMTAPFFIERHGADASRIPYAVYIAENGSSQCHDVTIDGGSVFPSQDATYGPDWRMIYAGSALRSDSAVRVQTVNSLMLGKFVDEDASRFDRVVIEQGNHKIGVGQNVNVDGYRAPGDTADRFANRPNGPWWSDGSSVADTGLNRTAGLDVPGVLNVIDKTGAQLGSVLKPSLTATNLLDVGHWINTWGKVTGRQVWDATNGLLVVASGAAASDPWRWAWGDTAYTPGGSASPPIVPITRGGTNADNATDARTNLGAEVAGAAALAQAAAEAYADGLVTGAITGRSWKDPVRVVATVNLTLSGTQTIDGVAVIAGDRVLATAQTSGANNGPWVVASGAWTRPTDFDTSAEAVPGSVFPASEGTDNGNREWFLTTDAPITLGTTVLTFASVPMSAPVTSVDGLAGAVVLPTDAAAGTGSKRTLGTGPTQAAAGNDSRLSDSRAPTAHASTHIGGGADAIPTAVASGAAGLLSGTDKAKLDNQSGTNTGDQTLPTLASLGADPVLVPTAVKTTTYTAAANDLVPCDTTSGGFTVTLPNAPADKTRVAVKHVIQGGSNVVTVACAGSDVFNKAGGATTLTLSLLAQAVVLQYKASGAIWYIVADDLPLAQLDLRYDPTSGVNFAGVKVPKRSLDRMRSEVAPRYAVLNTTMNNSTTTLVVVAPGSFVPDLTRAGVADVVRIDSEQMMVTAASAGTAASGGTVTLTVVRGVNGTTAASHTAGASVVTSGVLNICWCGDSIVSTVADDVRRDLDRRLGGSLGFGFRGLWRGNEITATPGVNNTGGEWAFLPSGTVPTVATGANDVGPWNVYKFAAGTANTATWTRPPGIRVAQLDIFWVDLAAGTGNWSYSTDGGTTWVDNPNYPASRPAAATLMKSSVVVSDPTTLIIRAANAAGTTADTYLSGVDVWSTAHEFGVTTGFKLHEISFGGNYLLSFVAGTGDWGRIFDGDAASLVPTLVIAGPFSNDAVPPFSGAFDAAYVTAWETNLTTIHTRVSPYADLLYVNCYEQDRSPIPTSNQTTLRASMTSVAATYGHSIIDLYLAYISEGVVGYTAANSAGLMADTAHPSALGQRDIAARFSRLLATF